MKNRSLTRTLIIGVLLAELTCALLFSLLALAHEMSGRRHGFDVMLRGRADSVLGAIQDAEDRDDNVIVDQTELPLPGEDAYEVLMDSGRIVGKSSGSSPAILSAFEAQHTDGYFNFTANGKRYRALRQPGLRVIDREDQVGGLRRPVTILYAAPTAHLWNEAFETVRFYVIASCLLVILTGIAIAWFLRSSLSPLRELALRAEAVSADSWDFHPPQQALQTRELEPIATSIEKLLRSLRSAFDRQRQFTGDAAHELKTSIALLKSRLQLISMRERTPTEYQLSIEELLTDTQRMEHLTNRMLTLARLEQSSFDIEVRTNLSIALQEVVARLSPAAAAKHLSITCNASAHAPVQMDAHDADLLCSNLVMNAIQHSPNGAAISVATSQTNTSVHLLIADNGIGIPPEALPHIFERFYRGDPSRSRANGGAGLGLAICKAIVTRANGTISVESNLGSSTRVAVTLPIATAPNGEPDVRTLTS